VSHADLEDVFLQVMSDADRRRAALNRIEHSALAQAGELPAPTLLPSSWVGFRTLLYKEVLRFWKVAFQTIAAPVLTACCTCWCSVTCWISGSKPSRACATARSWYRAW